jgi:putative Mg2+ transporter-C (MgtC) family protein
MGDFMEYLKELNSVSILLRLLLAILCGGVVGLERGQKNRPAGFRTYMLVSMGSALVMIVSQYIFITFGNTDVMRMGAQVVSGIGFLGAGTIIVTSKMKVKGLTTAAGLWAVACMGIAIGIGFYSAAIISCILIFVLLTAFRVVETKLGQKSKQMNIYLELKNVHYLGDILKDLKVNKIKVLNIEITREVETIEKVIILLDLLNSKKSVHNEMIENIGAKEGVLHIEEY